MKPEFILYYLLAGAAGMVFTYFFYKNKIDALQFNNVKNTMWLMAVIVVVASLFSYYARFYNYGLCFAYLVGSAFLSYKFFEKKAAATNQPMRLGRTMAQAEKKSDTWLFIALSAITVLVFLCTYVFSTDLRLFMLRAADAAQVAGIFLFIAAELSLLWLYKSGGVTTSKTGPGIVWIILLALAISTACGFNFDYFGLK